MSDDKPFQWFDEKVAKQLTLIENLIARAIDPAATEEEQRTSSVIAIKAMQRNDFVEFLRMVLKHLDEMDRINNS